MHSEGAMELKEDGKLVTCKKRKLYSELEDDAYCVDDVESSKKEDELVKDAVSSRSSDLEKVDLVYEGLGTADISPSINAVFSSGNTTPTRDLSEDDDSKQLLMTKLYLSSPPTPRKITPSPANLRRKIPPEIFPSAAELDKFFAASEKLQQQRFAEKYNYDIVKDVPLTGKYDWVRLLP